MKILQPINQNIPVWAVIKGDHACGDLESYLSPKLITTPDFLNAKQNALRLEYLKNTKGRRWLYDLLVGQSFAEMEIERSDIENVLCVWKDVPMIEVAKQFKEAYEEKRSFKYKEIEKPWECVKDVKRRQRQLPSVDAGWITDFNEEYDYHRSIWTMNKDQKLQVIDGTHRTLATTWRYLLDKNRMPKTWKGIVFYK